MNKIPMFGFIISESAPRYTNIYEFENAMWDDCGPRYGKTVREAIINACKDYYQDCTLWGVPRNPVGYLVVFDEDGNVESVEQQTLCIHGETTYTLEFAEDDKETFFKASN